MMRQFCHGRTDGQTNGDPDTRVYDACIHDAAYLSCMYKPRMMHIYIMHVCIMHIHMLLDHVCTMHIHMLLDNDAYVHDAYICDIQSLTMLHVCMMQLKFCDQPTNNFVTNKQGDSRSRIPLRDILSNLWLGPECRKILWVSYMGAIEPNYTKLK